MILTSKKSCSSNQISMVKMWMSLTVWLRLALRKIISVVQEHTMLLVKFSPKVPFLVTWPTSLITTENSLPLSTIWMIGSSMLLRIRSTLLRRHLKMKVSVSTSIVFMTTSVVVSTARWFCLCWTLIRQRCSWFLPMTPCLMEQLTSTTQL